MKKVLILTFFLVSAINAKTSLQEKLRVVATQVKEIKNNIKSGDYILANKCNSGGGCRVDSCKR